MKLSDAKVGMKLRSIFKNERRGDVELIAIVEGKYPVVRYIEGKDRAFIPNLSLWEPIREPAERWAIIDEHGVIYGTYHLESSAQHSCKRLQRFHGARVILMKEVLEDE